MNNRYDLIVIGGGPAGSGAAITAARAGARVLLLERGRLPRHRVCGEFISGEALSLLHELLDPRRQALLTEAVRITKAEMHIDGCTLRTSVTPPAASIARLDLDFALWESAEEGGAHTLQQNAVGDISGAGPFLVRAAEGQYESRAVICAAGRWSNLTVPSTEAVGAKWLGIKAHFAEPPTADSVDLYFFEGGYCGVQPVAMRDEEPTRINVCAMVRADIAATLPQVFALHAALHERSHRWRPRTDPVSTSPLIFRAPEPERKGVLNVGDAAAFVDPFLGDGISLALRSGSLAARCLLPFLRSQTSLAEAAANYRREYERQFAHVFRSSSRIRQLLSLPRAVRSTILFLLRHNPAITQHLVRRTR